MELVEDSTASLPHCSAAPSLGMLQLTLSAEMIEGRRQGIMRALARRGT